MSQSIIFQRIEGLAIFLSATLVYFYLGFSWPVYVLLLFVFDVSMIGYLINTKVGAFVYNIGHSFILPSALGLGGIITGEILLVSLSLIWFAHCGLDRSLGYGLKSGDSFKHTHLGIIGR